jgi:hypothetical protein
MSTYRNRATSRDAAIADQANAEWMACGFCGGGCDRETLSAFGARCRLCFDAYRAELNRPGPAPTAAERQAIVRKLRQPAAKVDPKGWAKALRDREQRGEAISRLQHAAWREALRVPAEGARAHFAGGEA